MEVFYHKSSKLARDPGQEGGQIVIYASRPSIIQPAEIIKINVDLSFKIETGYIFILNTHPSLIQKTCQIFPTQLILTSDKKYTPLEVSLINQSRNQVQIMEGASILIGFITQSFSADLKEGKPEIEQDQEMHVDTKKPKGKGIRFDIKV